MDAERQARAVVYAMKRFIVDMAVFAVVLATLAGLALALYYVARGG